MPDSTQDPMPDPKQNPAAADPQRADSRLAPLDGDRPRQSYRPELPPDPGSRKIAALLWPVVLVLFGLVVYQQQDHNLGTNLKQAAPSTAPVQAVDPTKWAETDEEAAYAVIARAMIKVGHSFKLSNPSAPIGSFVDEGLAPQVKTPTDKVRTVIAIGELQDATRALKRIDELEAGELTAGTSLPTPSANPDLSANPPPVSVAPSQTSTPEEVPLDMTPLLREDLKTLRTIYEGKKSELAPVQKSALIEHHEKLGRIALTFKDLESGERAELLPNVMGNVGVLMLLIVAALGAFLASFFLLPFMIAMFATRRLRPRFVPPAPGGSVFLETFGVFLAGFFSLKLIAGLLSGLAPGQHWPMYATMGVQWALAAIVFWPRLRGMSGASWSSAIGLHSGRGIAREIFAGIVGYISGLPMLLLAGIIVAVLVLLREFFSAGKAAPLDNPIKDILAQNDVVLHIMLASAAVIWAPFVEESIFRGSVYRHLRSRWNVLFSAGVTALFFTLLHPLPPILMLPIFTLGFTFAMLREWRGSMIANITAHALHNGFIMLMAFTVLDLVK